MHENQTNFARFGVAILVVLAVAAALSGRAFTQSRTSLKSAWISHNAAVATRAERARQQTGAPDDWSHRHLIFSNPGTDEHAMRAGTLNAWMNITNDPRFILQQKKRAGRSQTLALAGRNATVAGSPIEPWPVRKPTPKPKPRPITRFGFAKRMHRDWGLGVSTGNPSPVSYPAKWSFDTTTTSCTNDFVVYPTGADEADAQASIVAYFNLYSGCGGTVPSVDWAYDTGGVVTGAPSFSFDGSQIAFIQNTGGAASLVLLRIPLTPPGTGTVDAPITLTPLSAVDYTTCAAPCMTTFPLSGGASDTLSNPWIDYAHDSLFVGDDAGNLHKFFQVFTGSPDNPPGEVLVNWPVALTGSLGSPVFDPATGLVFVGSAAGIFYSVGAGTPGFPSVVSGQIVGTSDPLGPIGAPSAEEIVDGPIIDSAAGMAYVFVQDDGDGNNAVFQFLTSFTAGSGTEEAVGTFGTGAEFFLSGTFDNIYFTSEDSCGDSGCTPTGNLYVGGNTVGPATLYQIPITANVMGTPNVGPALETTTLLPLLAARNSPVTEFFNANGGAATGTVGIESDPSTWTSGGSRSVTLGSVTYTFVDTPPADSTATAVEVSLVSTDGEEPDESETAANLAAAINANPAECFTAGCFGAGTVANVSATASIVGSSVIVNLTATNGGPGGDFALSEIGSGVNVAGGLNGSSPDFIFFSTLSVTRIAGCPTGCVLSFDVTSGATIDAGTTPNAMLPVDAINTDSADGFVTGGIIVDNDQVSGTLTGTSQIYFLTLYNAAGACSTSGSGICAVQASQAGLK